MDIHTRGEGQAIPPATTGAPSDTIEALPRSAENASPYARNPRWTITRVASKPSTTSTVSPLGAPRRPAGAVGILTDRVLVQTSAGSQLDAILPYVDQAHSGLVLGRGRMTNRKNLHALITGLASHGSTAPVVFDPEGYRRHVATTELPFHLEEEGMLSETLEENLTNQRVLGADVALTPTGFIRANNVDALEVAAEQADQLKRDDFMLTVPLDVTILDSPPSIERAWRILNGLSMPIALVLGGQFDPLDKNAEARVTTLRSFATGPAHVAILRTDFNALDLLCHGSFTGAIGSGGTMRHATDPGERPRSANPDDESPSVLYERLASWWRGSKIAREHGRMPAPTCECPPCNNRRISRFLSRDDSADARAHSVIIWQRLARLIVEQPTVRDRAVFWRKFCQTRIDEHALLSTQLRRAKSLSARPALKAWARLPA